MEYGFSLTSRVHGWIGISLICDDRFDALDTVYEVAHMLDQTAHDGGRGGVLPVFIKETFRSLRLRDRSCGRKCSRSRYEESLGGTGSCFFFIEGKGKSRNSCCFSVDGKNHKR
jgi:hypothetical protein